MSYNNLETRQPKDIKNILKSALYAGLKKGWKNFLWMAKITVPISLAVALLKWTGWLYRVDFILDPVMRLLQLPSEAAFPILSGLFINIYAVIAILTVVPFSPGQMIMIAVFTLIAHNIITEAVIQHKSGMNAFKIIAIRITVAIITVLAISPFMGDTQQSVTNNMINTARLPLLNAMGTWATDTGWLLLKVLALIMSILIVLECLARLEWDKYLYRIFQPFMKFLGLSDRSVMLWVTAVLFGLMYGSAVILEKAREGNLTRGELERLHISIGINHSMVEDPALYMALGLNGFWLLIPKLLMAIISVQIYRLIVLIRGKTGTGRAAV